MSEKLSDVVTIISGGTPKTSVKEFWDGDIDWLAVADFNSSNRYVSSASKKITELGLNNSNTKMLEKGDLIISARGTVGAIAQLTKPMAFNQSCFGLRGKKDKLDTDYLYYWLKNYVDVLLNKSQGSVFNTINLSTFDDIKIELPSIADQRKISNLLTLLDDKIETNNQINQELEAMAKTLYDYWFVQFDFPDQNGKPYKSSGGKMVYHPELKREIPEGWGVESLVDNTLSTVIKPGIDEFTQKTYLATADVVNTSIKGGRLITYDNRETRANMQPSVNSVWFAKMKSSNKHLFLSHSMKELIDSTILSTGFMGLQCKEESFEYLASFISDPDFEIFKDKLSHGATQQAVNVNDLKSILVTIPDDYTLHEFHKKVKSIFLNIGRNTVEDKYLNSLRDWLLPMLMNGQVKVE